MQKLSPWGSPAAVCLNITCHPILNVSCDYKEENEIQLDTLFWAD